MNKFRFKFTALKESGRPMKITIRAESLQAGTIKAMEIAGPDHALYWSETLERVKVSTQQA